MASSYAGKPCPKCAHVRAETETAPEWQCPKCGIAYHKFVEAQAQAAAGGFRAASVGTNAGTNAGSLDLMGHREVFITQKFELMEMISVETRNRYRISDAAGRPIGYAAEEQTGLMGFLFRQLFGHWRTFEIHFYDNNRQVVLNAVHPFRIYFSRLEVYTSGGQMIGAIQKRFSILTKKFCVEDARGVPIMEVSSPVWKLWTFPFVSNGEEVACVKKKWSGILSESLTDRDNFSVEFSDALGNDARKVVLAAAVYIDLTYFEKKG